MKTSEEHNELTGNNAMATEKYITENNIIYPGELARLLGINLNSAYNILEEYANKGVLQQCVLPKCYSCGLIFPEIISVSLLGLPDHFSCPKCGERVISMRDNVVVYKKLSNKEK